MQATQKNKRGNNIMAMGAGFGLSAALFGAYHVTAFEKPVSLPTEELVAFSEVYSQIKQAYVEEVDDKKLITDAIRGMLSGLDPHSSYLDEEAFKDLSIGTSGKFGGLGIEVGMENGFVKVISPIDDTPAQRAGMEAGDLIIRLDDKPVKGMTLMDAVNVMRGEPGDPIELLVVREGKDKPFKVKIVRDIIKIKSVKQKILQKGLGYIRISSFQSKTTDGVENAVKTLIKENDGKPLDGVILDLRNNPGGVLDAAVGVSDVFLEKSKLIVYTEGRINNSQMRFKSKTDDMLESAPIVVLVNQGSASASEIVAGALKDHKRAIIAGDKTFGKGSVQTIMRLDQKTALKMTTARYFTPSGVSIQAKGIEPDIKIDLLKLAEQKESEEDKIASLREADLNRHLEGLADKDKKDDKKDDTEASADKDTEALARSDYALYEALNILKSMRLVKQMQTSEKDE